MHAIPILLGTMVGVVLGLIAQASLRFWSRRGGDTVMEPSDDVFLGLVAVGAFFLGVFVTYVLFRSS